MNKIKSLLKKISILSVIVLIIAGASGCSKIENLSNSGSQLVIVDVTAKDLTTTTSHTCFSDVIKVDPVTLNTSVYNDNGVATLTAQLLDPDVTAISTYYQDVVVDQIDVSFSRADGLNVPGKDVPYSFSQKVSVRIPIQKSILIDFVLVSHNAKAESPLVELLYSGTILKLEAKITIYGKDVAGNRVQPVVGYISVWCGDFADQETEEN